MKESNTAGIWTHLPKYNTKTLWAWLFWLLNSILMISTVHVAHYSRSRFRETRFTVTNAIKSEGRARLLSRLITSKYSLQITHAHARAHVFQRECPWFSDSHDDGREIIRRSSNSTFDTGDAGNTKLPHSIHTTAGGVLTLLALRKRAPPPNEGWRTSRRQRKRAEVASGGWVWLNQEGVCRVVPISWFLTMILHSSHWKKHFKLFNFIF